MPRSLEKILKHLDKSALKRRETILAKGFAWERERDDFPRYLSTQSVSVDPVKAAADTGHTLANVHKLLRAAGWHKYRANRESQRKSRYMSPRPSIMQGGVDAAR